MENVGLPRKEKIGATEFCVKKERNADNFGRDFGVAWNPENTQGQKTAGKLAEEIRWEIFLKLARPN